MALILLSLASALGASQTTDFCDIYPYFLSLFRSGFEQKQRNEIQSHLLT